MPLTRGRGLDIKWRHRRRRPARPGSRRAGRPAPRAASAPRLSSACRVWFTISHGILNEVYYPRVDHACTRDLGLIVMRPRRLLSRRRSATPSMSIAAVRGWRAGLSADQHGDRRQLPDREADRWSTRHGRRCCRRSRFTPLKGALADYRVYALLAPHLVNAGMGNTAWIGDYKGTDVLFASGAAASRWRSPRRCRGGAARPAIVGFSDGWQQLHARRPPRPGLPARRKRQRRADRRDRLLRRCADQGAAGAGLRRRARRKPPTMRCASLRRGFDAGREGYVAGLARLAEGRCCRSTARRRPASTPTASARPCWPRTGRWPFRAPAVASLSIPWGFSKGDEDLGGYHLVWPRDLVETAGGFLAAGAAGDALRDPRLSPRHPGGGRPLAAERLARRLGLLGRHPDGRMRLPDPARRRAAIAPATCPAPRCGPSCR